MTSLELSLFQKEKLRYYFKFLVPNEENIIESRSIERLMEKVCKYTSWAPDGPRALQFFEVHTDFFETLFEKTNKEDGKDRTVTLEDWHTFWSNTLAGCKGMNSFPIWLRLMPKVLFSMMDRNENGVLEPKELTDFYREMVSLSAHSSGLDKWSKQAYAEMTDNSHYPLNLDTYEQVFANFLLGRTPHGPGKYIFGCFKHVLAPFQLIQPSPDEDEDTSVGIREVKEKRPRKFDVVFT